MKLTPSQDTIVFIALEDRKYKMLNRIKFYEKDCTDETLPEKERAEMIDRAREQIAEIDVLMGMLRA